MTLLARPVFLKDLQLLVRPEIQSPRTNIPQRLCLRREHRGCLLPACGRSGNHTSPGSEKCRATADGMLHAEEDPAPPSFCSNSLDAEKLRGGLPNFTAIQIVPQRRTFHLHLSDSPKTGYSHKDARTPSEAILHRSEAEHSDL